jgi:hypothetical protein
MDRCWSVLQQSNPSGREVKLLQSEIDNVLSEEKFQTHPEKSLRQGQLRISKVCNVLI